MIRNKQKCLGSTLRENDVVMIVRAKERETLETCFNKNSLGNSSVKCQKRKRI